MKQVKNVAIEAALAAGKIIKENFGQIKSWEIKKDKTRVSQVDFLAQNKVIELIKKYYPHHDFFAEEGEEKLKRSENFWIIDPLDGTLNYTQNIPIFSVSIAFLYRGDIQTGVVYNPISNELFWGMRGHGAYLNDQPIFTSKIRKLSESVGNMGGASGVTRKDPGFLAYLEIAPRVKKLRMIGSASLSYAYAASGKFDFVIDFHVHWWDVAASILLMEEAGGKLTNEKGEKLKLTSQEINIIASNNYLLGPILKIIKKIK